jgi:hypothetical protein
MFFTTPVMLLGLGVVLLPVIIHFFNRRRVEIVDWAAMQFLQVSEVTRRRLMFDDWLLLLLRMLLLALLVLALAGPYVRLSLPANLAGRASRDLVLLLDGSASMSAVDSATGKTLLMLAQENALALLDELLPEDSVSLILAREQPVVLLATSVDRPRLRRLLNELPEPAGSCSWPSALKAAREIIENGQKGQRQILLLGDGQRFGLADPETLVRWELLRLQKSTSSRVPTRICMIDLASQRQGQLSGLALGTLQTSRAVVPVDREVVFRSEIILSGLTTWTAPRMRVEIDGKPIRDLAASGATLGGQAPKDGRVAFSFSQRFAKPGTHLVSLFIDPDPSQDLVRADNRQDLVVEVLQAIDVLLITGDPTAARFLRDALQPASDPTPSVRVRMIRGEEFQPSSLSSSRPQVVVLHDLATLTENQSQTLAAFLAEGGGVLVALGERSQIRWYNDTLWNNGRGWLPARIEGPAATIAKPELESFTHPLLELFQQSAAGGLNEARIPQWWKLTTAGQNAQGTPIGRLVGDVEKWPIFVEGSYRSGRVILSAIPLDASKDSNLIELPAFVPLVHESIYRLAGVRTEEFNLTPGKPIRLRVEEKTKLEQIKITPPVGPTRPLSEIPGVVGTYPARTLRSANETTIWVEQTALSGIYKVETPTVKWYVVRGDAREGDLRRCIEEEIELVKQKAGIEWLDSLAQLEQGEDLVERRELWFVLMLGVVVLLCVEVWFTRRLAMRR